MAIEDKIHIGLCADGRYAMPLGVCVTSILENNKANKVVVHIITKGFDEENSRRLKLTARKYNQEVILHIVKDDIFENLPQSDIFPHSIYYRYLFPQVVDETINKILYLDCDILVLSDLSKLWYIDIGDSPIAAVQDANGDDIINRNRIDVFDGRYLNSGALVLNLNYWRKHHCLDTLSEFISNNPEKCLYPDQDALNVIFHNKIFWLPFSCNFQITLMQPFESYRLCKTNWPEIIDSFKDIIILHYSSYDGKPWFVENNSDLDLIWKYYWKLSLWGDVRLSRREGAFKRLVKNLLRYRVRNYEVNPCLKKGLCELMKKYY